MTSAWKRKKTKRIAIVGVLSLLLIAALCFIFGFAISEGWEAVAKWFTSKWATLTIIAVAFVLVAGVFLWFAVKDREDFR